MTFVQEQLREVFLLDQQLRGLRGRLDQLQDHHHREEVKAEQLTQQRGEIEQQLKITQVAATTAEKRVKEVEQRIDHLRGQMNSVHSNKEYSATLIEVNTAKQDLGKIEEAALTLMTRADILRQELTDIDQKLDQQTRRVSTAKTEVDQCLSEIDQELGELSSRREQAEQQVPTEAKSIFDRVSHIHDGETIADVVEVNRRTREYSCGGCYMSIPVERLNALMCDRNSVVCCPNCGRILYVDQELRTSFSGK